MLVARNEQELTLLREIVIMSETSKLLGTHLALIRTRRGWTQEQASQAAEIHIRTLKSIELGDANPNLLTIESLANAYGVTLSAIFEPWKLGSGSAEPHLLCKKLEIILKDPTQKVSITNIINAFYKQLKK